MNTFETGLAGMFGRNIKNAAAELPENAVNTPLPDGLDVALQIVGIKVTESPNGKNNIDLTFQIVEPTEYVGRFMYSKIPLTQSAAIAHADPTDTKEVWNYASLIDLLWECGAINPVGAIVGYPDPEPIFLSSCLGRIVYTRVRNSTVEATGKTYSNPSFLKQKRKIDTIFPVASSAELFKKPGQRQQPTKRLPNDNLVLDFWKTIPREFTASYITNRLTPPEPMPRGTEVLGKISNITETVSQRGNPVLKIRFIVVKNSADKKYNGRTVFHTCTLNVQQGAESVANLAEVTGIINSSGELVDSQTPINEQFLNKEAVFYVSCSEQGYNNIETEFYPVSDVSHLF